jgi:hypothetical protein
VQIRDRRDRAHDEEHLRLRTRRRTKKTIEGSRNRQDQKADESSPTRFIPKRVKEAPKRRHRRLGHFGSVLVSLRQAVDDADNQRAPLAVTYPMAATSLPRLQPNPGSATVYTADVVEENWASAPSREEPPARRTMEGGKVAITLNGLSQADLSKTTIGDVTSRSPRGPAKKWVGPRAQSPREARSRRPRHASFEDVYSTV